ncbi:MAG: futalosine hydrolase [Nitrospirae bacterium]|nr:MAG: futalosine hydrolase [Nitrospirota bacterium]
METNKTILLLFAVQAEAGPFLNEAQRTITIGPKKFYILKEDSPRIVLGLTGVGKASASMTTAIAISQFKPDLVLNLGIGGGFKQAGVDPLCLCVATEDLYADEGVITSRGFSDLSSMGLRVLEGEENPGIFPTSSSHTKRLKKLLDKRGILCLQGRFITVSTVTGTDERAEYLYRRFKPLCESMEGAAVGHVSRAFGVGYLEVRAISNIVGRRQRHKWKTEEAFRLLHQTTSLVLDNIHWFCK